MMKKIILIILAFFLTSNLFAQIIDFPDVKFKNKLLMTDVGVGMAYGCSGGSFKIDANNDGEIDVSEALMVCSLTITGAAIEDLTGIEYFTNLRHLNVNNNKLTELDLSPLIDMEYFHALNNNLTSLNISGLTNLNRFDVNNNDLTSIDISGLPNLTAIYFNNNEISSFNFNDYPQLTNIGCRNNPFSSIDVSELSSLSFLDCSAIDNLETVYIKTGSKWSNLNFSDNPNLKYICANPENLDGIWDRIIEYGYTDCFTNSICSYEAGEDFFTVFGHAKYDEEEDGCDPTDIDFPNLRLSFSDENNSGDVLATETGDYHYSIQSGTYTIVPQLENPDYFLVSPPSVSVTFPTESSPLEQNFCITPNGPHPDLEVTLKGVGDISANDDFLFPGANADYSITYWNKGTQTQSGALHFSFDGEVSHYISSNPEITSSQEDLLVWEFTDLKPFESRKVGFTLYINSPADNPPLYEDDLFYTTVTLITPETDETPEDNTFSLTQLVTSFSFSTPDYSFSHYFGLYPNPTDQFLNLKVKNEIDIKTIEIYNLSGKRVIANTYHNDFSSIDVSALQAGTYFLKIYTSKGIFDSRFIKK